ncbi:hypothetical protein G9A89_008690 [Geosiphon pyriformis]|nr:hypothetical protein G9A89_008690 [Geosiphon pyriformis]
MLTRRRDETSEGNISSPKRLRVVESEPDAQYSTYCSTISSTTTYSIPPISPVEGTDFANQEFLTVGPDSLTLSLPLDENQEQVGSNIVTNLNAQDVFETHKQANILGKTLLTQINSNNKLPPIPDPLPVVNGSENVVEEPPKVSLITDKYIPKQCYIDNQDNEDDDEDDTSWREEDHIGEDSSEETSSLDDIISNLHHLTDEDEDEPTTPDTDYQNSPLLSDEECGKYKKEAKEKGTHKFVQEFFFEKKVPIRKLFYAFDYQLPSKIIGLSEPQLLPILHKVITKYLRQRQKLPHINTLEDTVKLLKESKNIMVLTGAGVSVSCGIPDFRSENGIYSRLSEFDLDDPQDMFDVNYFKDCPEVFYSFAKEIFPSNFKPSPSHCFVKLLEDKNKLLRNYTQNIDTLEQAAGIKKVLECHGSFATASCLNCGYKVSGDVIKEDILAKRVPYCTHCQNPNEHEDVESSGAIMKPDIVFFGEKLPPEFDERFPEDRELVDLLIVMGSSLKVAPVSEIMGQIPHRVPQIVINRTPIKHMHFDVQLLGDCDIIIPELCRLLEWEIVHEKLPSATSKEKKPRAYQFVQPNIYLFEGAVVKPGELLLGGDQVTTVQDDDEVVDVVGQTVVELGKNSGHGENKTEDII